MLGFKEILNNSINSWDLISNGFVFGYVQGVKANKAEMRRKRAANRNKRLTANS